MNKPCEYCGCDLPLGIDKPTRRTRSFHFARCAARPVNPFLGQREQEFRLHREASAMFTLLLQLRDAIEALEGTSDENDQLVDEYRAIVDRVQK